jgi:pimeloyl-ACP methyl ester carboxylesterase
MLAQAQPFIPLTEWQVIRDIFRFLDALQIEKCHLFGVGGGAAIAVRMAMLHTERILSLTLCSMGLPAPVSNRNPSG